MVAFLWRGGVGVSGRNGAIPVVLPATPGTGSLPGDSGGDAGAGGLPGLAGNALARVVAGFITIVCALSWRHAEIGESPLLRAALGDVPRLESERPESVHVARGDPHF